MVFFPSLLFLFQGTLNHEIQYTYEDHTEARKEEARQRELRRLENDQRQKEFQEKLRQRAEEAEGKVGQEKERRRAEYQQQRQREIEQEEARIKTQLLTAALVKKGLSPFKIISLKCSFTW